MMMSTHKSGQQSQLLNISEGLTSPSFEGSQSEGQQQLSGSTFARCVSPPSLRNPPCEVCTIPAEASRLQHEVDRGKIHCANVFESYGLTQCSPRPMRTLRNECLQRAVKPGLYYEYIQI